LKNRDYTHTF